MLHNRIYALTEYPVGSTLVEHAKAENMTNVNSLQHPIKNVRLKSNLQDKLTIQEPNFLSSMILDSNNG